MAEPGVFSWLCRFASSAAGDTAEPAAAGRIKNVNTIEPLAVLVTWMREVDTPSAVATSVVNCATAASTPAAVAGYVWSTCIVTDCEAATVPAAAVGSADGSDVDSDGW